MASFKLQFSLVLFACTVMAAAAAGRGMLGDAQKGEMKHPEWFYDSRDGSFLVPGIGRYVKTPGSWIPSITGGATGGAGGTTTAPRRYIPGGDDTFVPNPGFETPNPIP